MRKIISIKTQGCFVLGVVLLCGSRAGSAELLGSADQDIKNNFKQLITSNACKGCNLRGAVLSRLNLAGADLEGADLSGAWLNGSSLAGAKLRNAVLRGARLGGADLSQADLRGVDMSGADFSPDNGGSATQGKNPGQQAADSARNTVNSAIDELFANQGQQQPASTAAPPEEISLLSTPVDPAANAQATRRNVDEIPVIQHDNLLLEAQKEQKKSQPPQAANERVNEIVLQQIWPDAQAEKNKAEQASQPISSPPKN